MIALRRNTLLANRGSSRVRVGAGGSDCIFNQDKVRREVKEELLDKLKNFMNSTSLLKTPEGGWKDAAGNPVSPFDSPWAHKELYNLILADAGNTCIDAVTMKKMLALIGMDQSVCATSIGDGLVSKMDKDGDNCVSWPEYLNSIFKVGPASDSKAPDPTDPVAVEAARDGGRLIVPLFPIGGESSPPVIIRRRTGTSSPIESQADTKSSSGFPWKLALAGLGVGVLGAWVFG